MNGSKYVCWHLENELKQCTDLSVSQRPHNTLDSYTVTMTSFTQRPISYDDESDFSALAEEDPDFAKVFDASSARLDFHNAQAVK